jgi:DNA modification methylase
MKRVKLYQGNNIESLKKLPDNSIDSIVSDPPYGLSFMGKKWDYDVPSVEFWKEVLRVLKPGGHVLSFGGTRTYHRMVVNIEDAGFEIRDQIMWLYGSGFPKSHNIGKAVDKLQGNDREVVGKLENYQDKRGLNGQTENVMENAKPRIDIDITKGQSPYEGWGTAMKPAQEIITVAKKPEDLEGTALNLIYIIKNELWKLYVKIVESSSELNQVEQKEVLNIAQCLVEKNTNIQVALQGLMDMSQLRLMENMNWNIVLLWHNILEDLSQKMSRYTTSTKSNLIIDLKTLKSLEWQNILENITQVKNNQTDGLNVNALTAVVIFNVLNLKLKDIQQHSVEDNVIYKEDKMDCLNEPICVARKPLSEKSVAENVLKWGTGGINIDGCRVGSEIIPSPQQDTSGGIFRSISKSNGKIVENEGRFPANIILDEIAGELLDEQSGVLSKQSKSKRKGVFKTEYVGGENINKYETLAFSDSGGASRFFYQAKVSKAERNMGLDGFEDKSNGGHTFIKKCKNCNLYEVAGDDRELCSCESPDFTIPVNKNNHPTVKPVALMSYLCRLVTPPGGIVLDPFMGSGSTGIAAQLEGFRFCGMEMDEDYFKIASARIENFESYRKFLKK